jgi:serine/threonine-protein kinase
MGSPKYMAPEQIQGGHVDARTDIYSLGIIMYEMLAGKVPFERATSVNILMAHVGEPPPPMREVNPNLLCSPAFEDVVMRCIAKEPNERFSTMDEVLQAIRRAHGVSMTGQIAAMPAHGTGPYSVNNTGPPPPLAAWHPTPAPTPPPTFVHPAPMTSPMRPMYRSTPPPLGVTGSHTGMGMIRAEQSADYSGVIETKPRSKIWVLFGVLVAAGVGGGLGMLAFHWTAPKPPDPVPVPATTPSVVPSAAPSTAPSSSSSSSLAPSAATPPEPKGTVVHFVTEPPGASIKENGKELCAPTPCDVTFKGDDATKAHKLSIEEKGFKAETKSLKPSEATAKPIDVKLTKEKEKAVAPTPKPSAKSDSSPPSGFKDAYDK